jgi:hypothetical protein
MSRRRPLPPYLRVIGEPIAEPAGSCEIIVSPHGSSSAFFDVCTAPTIAAGKRMIEAAVTAISDQALDDNLSAAFDDDTLRDEIGEIVARHLREWIVRWLVRRPSAEPVENDHAGPAILTDLADYR